MGLVKKRSMRLLVGLAVLVALGVAAPAATIDSIDWDYDQQNLWPTEPDAEAHNLTQADQYKDAKGNRNLTQTFQLPDSYYDSEGDVTAYETGEALKVETIYIALDNSGSGVDEHNGFNFNLQLFEVADVNAGSLTEGTMLFDFVVNVPNEPNGEQVVVIELNDGPVLSQSSGTEGYGLQVQDGGNFLFQWKWGKPGQYGDGTSYVTGSSQSQDLALAMTGTVVPEPATMSLLAIGGLGMLLKRKRS